MSSSSYGFQLHSPSVRWAFHPMARDGQLTTREVDQLFDAAAKDNGRFEGDATTASEIADLRRIGAQMGHLLQSDESRARYRARLASLEALPALQASTDDKGMSVAQVAVNRVELRGRARASEPCPQGSECAPRAPASVTVTVAGHTVSTETTRGEDAEAVARRLAVQLAARGADVTVRRSRGGAVLACVRATEAASSTAKRGRVTGIGGVFFKVNDPQATKRWYAEHFGMVVDQYGTLFEFRRSDDYAEKAYLQWSPFSRGSNYFAPSTHEFMINYRVTNLDALLAELRQAGVTVVGEVDDTPYGKFAHVMDPDGNKIELWEPIDATVSKDVEGKTTK